MGRSRSAQFVANASSASSGGALACELTGRSAPVPHARQDASRLAFRQFEAKKPILGAYVQAAIGERRIGAAAEGGDLCVAGNFEFFGRGDSAKELTGVSEEENLIANLQHRSRAKIVPLPLELAGFQVNAPKIEARLALPMDRIEITVVVNAGRVLRGDVRACPDDFLLPV